MQTHQFSIRDLHFALAILTMTSVLASAAGSVAMQEAAGAHNWPTFRGDLRRSGSSQETINPRHLHPSWTLKVPGGIDSAWPAPAKWDAYASLAGMKSMRNYDPVLHPIAVQDADGAALFLGGVTDDTVRRFNATTGEEQWHFTADAPVRVAPTWHNGMLYFGSDDGCAYALDARTGKLRWKTEIVPGARWILNNGRMISPWPVRTGVHIADDIAYCAASLMPWEPTVICALDANTGKAKGDGRYIRELGTGLSMEGPLLVSRNAILVPQGRVAPLQLNRATGEPIGSVEGGGGSFVLLTEDDAILHGPGNKAGWITDSDVNRAKIAAYQKGNAIVVDGSTSFLLADATLSALDRTTRSLLYSVPTTSPHELIKVGETLFAGGEDHVSAYDASTGALLWEAPVAGNAFGLAFADGRLFVSTDEGAVHVFEERDTPSAFALAEPDDQGTGNTAMVLPKIAAIHDPALVDRWIFREDLLQETPVAPDDPRRIAVVANENPKRAPARFKQRNTFCPTPIGRFLELDGKSNELEVAGPGNEMRMPAQDMTALAVVRIDAPREWGGLFSAMQDNGADESGWILGFRGMRLGFGMRGTEKDDAYSWTLTPKPIVPGTWHVIAATYDGTTTKLYLDGVEVAQSQVEQGAIVYPEKYWYPIGAYRDNDEHFVTKGALAEMRLYTRPLQADEIKAIANQWQPLLDLPALPPPPKARPMPTVEPAAGPIFAFDQPAQALATWRTAKPVPTRAIVRLGGNAEPVTFETSGATPRTEHALRLTGLRADRIYEVQLDIPDAKGTSTLSRPYQLDTSFNYAPLQLDAGEVDHPAAMVALEESGIKRGLAIVLGADEPELALTLARNSQLRIQVLGTDAGAIESLREATLAAGAYGSRISARKVKSLARAPIPPNCANLIVGSRGSQLSKTVANKWLAPATGVYIFGTRAITAPEQSGIGVWTHLYGTPDNSCYGGETLDGVKGNDRLVLQWLGRPGPRYQSDRGNRKPAPLAISGRLFMQGLNRIIAVDSNNGSILWSLELPEVQRFNMPRDCSNWCADATRLFVAGGRLLVLDGATGDVLRTQDVHTPSAGTQGDFEWGYVARIDDLLIGSAQRKGNSHTGWWGSENWYDGKDNFSVLKVCSDSLFATEPDSGSIRWTYEPNALIINSTISAANGTLVFLEAGDDALFLESNRQIEDPRLWDDLEMVALDQATGEELWRRSANPIPGRIAMYTAISDGILYLQTSDDGAFGVYAFDLQNGESLWRRKFDWEADHHGKHLSRLAVAEGLLYLRPSVFDARTGEHLHTGFPEGHQCGNYACTKDSLILRCGDLTMWAPRQNEVSKWERLRPDCWLSTIPADGLLLSPEGGGGCSCGSWIETSMAFRPQTRGRAGDGLRAEPRR